MRDIRKAGFEYCAIALPVLALYLIQVPFREIRESLPFLFASLVLYAVPVAVGRFILSYCGRAGLKAGGIWEWAIRFVFWISITTLFVLYRDDCMSRTNEGLVVGAVIAAITGLADRIESWLWKRRKKPAPLDS